MTPVLECVNLSGGYGQLVAARQISLSVDAGEVVALVGSNGAGKTTTLLTMVGELAPISGEVLWNGEPVRSSLWRRARRGLAFIPEDKSVVMRMSCRDNLRLANAPLDVATELFPELTPLLERPAGLCSGGEQRILTFARALARCPSAVIVDELSLGLSPLIATRLGASLRAAADRGAAVLVVEQNLKRAISVSTRVCVMRHGDLVLTDDSARYRANIAPLEDLVMTGNDADEAQ
jgi:branched-chain amino acid transport system ATP-binding protein